MFKDVDGDEYGKYADGWIFINIEFLMDLTWFKWEALTLQRTVKNGFVIASLIHKFFHELLQIFEEKQMEKRTFRTLKKSWQQRKKGKVKFRSNYENETQTRDYVDAKW